MPTKNYKQKLLKYRICSVARIVACVSFLVLAVIGISSLARAMTLVHVDESDGVPTAWKELSGNKPTSVDIPITYWDQRMDDCTDVNRQFEWVACGFANHGAVQGMVQDWLGVHGHPIPTYTNASDAWANTRDIFTANVTGGNPVAKTDNFYRWFHELTINEGTPQAKQVSKQIDGRHVTFHRKEGEANTYEYGSKGTFPLEDVHFSDEDADKTDGDHNYHFTAHMTIPMRLSTKGDEKFWFSGDDDVWVFLNNRLVLDLGGLHEDLQGYFTIGEDGYVTSHVQQVADLDCRVKKNIPKPSLITNQWTSGYGWNSGYNDAIAACTSSDENDYKVTKITDIKFEPGQIVNLDFFYAERSSTESNTRITIENMEWPISAASTLNGQINKVEGKESQLAYYQTSVTNRDPAFELELERMAVYIKDQYNVTHDDGSEEVKISDGFVDFGEKTLYYTTTPEDESSWKEVIIAAPGEDEGSFVLAEPLTMSKSGLPGDTLYFRYLVETSEYTGTIFNTTSYYTNEIINDDKVVDITYNDIALPYTGTVKPSHNVKVTYRIDFGDEEPDPEIVKKTPKDVNEVKREGESYNIPSPEIDGFTPDIRTVSGVMGTEDVTYEVVYTRTKTAPAEFTLTIIYVDEDDNPVAKEFTGTFFEGDDYSVTSPDVPGYTTDTELVSGKMPGEDLTIKVTYVRRSTPETPETPSTPAAPTTPSTPAEPDDTPTIPPVSDDDDLVQVDPLGEVAYVPNTGIVSDVIAPLFTVYFAEAILSQWFVMAVLLVFAGSFAVYFSMRKYLDLKNKTLTANASKTTTRKAPRKSSKTTSAAKTSVKTRKTVSKKSSKTAAKSTTSKRKTSK